MKFVTIYIVSILIWSILLNYYQHMQNRKRRPMKNETLVISVSLIIAPLTLLLVLSALIIKLVSKYSNRNKVKVEEVVGDKP